METFSGFAHNGGVLIRFRNHRLPTLPTNDESLTNDNLIWLDLSESPARRIPFRSNPTIDETGIILDPLTTLRPGHRYAVIVKKTLWTDDTCFEPNNDFNELLSTTEMPSFGDARLPKALTSHYPSCSSRFRTLLAERFYNPHGPPKAQSGR